MPTQSKSFCLLFLAYFCLVILFSSCAVTDTSSISHRSHAVADTSFVNHSTLSVGTTLSTYSEHLNAVSAVAWSPDGKRLASASYDKTVQVWDRSPILRHVGQCLNAGWFLLQRKQFHVSR